MSIKQIMTGPIGRTFRAVLGLSLLSLTVTGPHTMWGLLGLLPLVTGATGFCPIFPSERKRRERLDPAGLPARDERAAP